MKRLFALSIACILSAVACPARAQDANFGELLDKSIQGLSAEKIQDRRGAQQAIENACLQLGAPDKAAQRAAACKLIAKHLDAKTAAPARIFLLRQLERIGRAESVDAVANLLADKDAKVQDAARRALTANPEGAAADKLHAAMTSAQDGSIKAQLINSLGYRRHEPSTDAIAKALASDNKNVANAAAKALGKIASPAAAAALAARRKTAAGALRLTISDSYLLCADAYLKRGDKLKAAAIYRELSQKDEHKAIRRAALQGVLKTAGK